MMEKSIEDAQLTILLEIDGQVHLIGMSKDKLDAITTVIKSAVEVVVPTNRSQKDLRDFLNVK